MDMLPAFAQTSQPDSFWRALPNDDHPNEHAHRLVADEFATYLHHQQLVPAPSPLEQD
jgi:hypothetical protein